MESEKMEKKIKKVYIDRASGYIEVEFVNGEKHAIADQEIECEKSEEFTEQYKAELTFEDN
jgi:hypothetical protein